MRKLIKLLIVVLAAIGVSSQSSSNYTDANYNITFALYSYQGATNSSLSPYYPNDTIRTASLTPNYLLIMDSYNVIQIWYRTNPALMAKGITSLKYINTYLTFLHLTMDFA
jgi:hypothetical protein